MSKEMKNAIRLGKLLTPRQKKFCDLILSGSSKKNAYIKAGYSPHGDAKTISAKASGFLAMRK